MRVYGRPSCGGRLALVFFYLLLLAFVIWGCFQINEILFLWVASCETL